MGAAFSSLTRKDLLDAAPTYPAQIALAGIHSVVWYTMINHVLPPIVKRIINSLKSKDRFLALNKEVFKKILQYDMGDDPEFVLHQVAEFQGVIVQHGLGGLLCVPSCMGLASRLPFGMTAGALARHGALCEVGWEIQDVGVRLWEMTFGGELGRKKNPTPLLIMFAMHHSAALSLVLPLNVHYPENTYYHEGVFLLQGAAFAANMFSQYGYTLDVKTRSGLRQMQATITASSAIMWWSRAIRYSYVWGSLLRQFYRDGDWTVLKLCAIPVLSMSLFNLAILGDAAAKFVKFASMEMPDEESATAALAASKLVRHPSSFTFTKGHREWSKIRGALHMGVLKRGQEDKKD